MSTETTLRTETMSLSESVKTMVVQSNDDYEAAGNARKEIKQTLKNITGYWSPKKDQAFQLHKSLVAAEKDMTRPLEEADKLIDKLMGDYRKEQDRIRYEAAKEQRRLETEARMAAEEAQRLIDEASEMEELDDDAVELLRMAQADLHNAELLVDVTVVPEAVAMKGVTVVKTWKARIVADALVPVMVGRILLRPVDMGELNKLAKAGVEVPGVEFYQEESTRVRL